MNPSWTFLVGGKSARLQFSTSFWRLFALFLKAEILEPLEALWHHSFSVATLEPSGLRSSFSEASDSEVHRIVASLDLAFLTGHPHNITTQRRELSPQ